MTRRFPTREGGDAAPATELNRPATPGRPRCDARSWRDRAGRDWSEQHDGLRPSAFVAGWLRVVDGLATPLAGAGVPADAVTVAGAALAWLAVPAAAADQGVLAGLAVLLSGLLDGLDGALARASGRTCAHGAVLDRSADRVGEVAAAVALVLLGAPWWLAAAALALGAAVEAVRTSDRRRRRAARPPTVGERPTRVLVAGMAALAAGATSGWPSPWDLPWAGLGAGAWATACALGLGQLAVAGRRDVDRPSGGADEPGDHLG